MNASANVSTADLSGTGSQQLPTSDTLLSQSLASSTDSQQLTQTAAKLNGQTNNLVSSVNNNNRFGMTGSQYGYGQSSMYGGGYSSYGGYGSSYGGGMYGSSMMGGYSGMGGGMMMNQQNPQQQQQPGFRDEYQGVLMGFNSMLNIMGAGIGMIGYGTTFFSITKKALVFIFQGLSNLTYKILCISYLKKLYNWMTNQDLQKDFAKTFEIADKTQKSSLAKRLLGKALVVVRVLSGLALLAFYFAQYRLRKRMNQMKLEQENLQNFDSELGPIIFDNQIPKQDNQDQKLIQINMNSEKAEIIDELDNALNEEEQEEEKEICQEQNKDPLDETIVEINDITESLPKVENLQDAFDNVINKEKSFIQQTQVRSEEFWKHTQPTTEFTAEISNAIPTLSTEMSSPIITSATPELISSASTPVITPSVSNTTVKKAAKPWMKNV